MSKLKKKQQQTHNGLPYLINLLLQILAATFDVFFGEELFQTETRKERESVMKSGMSFV